MKLNAVFRLVEDLNLRVIWAQVALAAIVGLPRESRAKLMTTVARGASTFATVGIDAANATVRPCIGIKLAVAGVFHFAPMALPTAVDCCRYHAQLVGRKIEMSDSPSPS